VIKKICLLFFLFGCFIFCEGQPSIQWQKCFGGTENDLPAFIQQTSDGGYVTAGFAKSNNGDVSGHHGSTFYEDYWIVKIDGSGTLEWQKSLGGSQSDHASSIHQTIEGGYIVVGRSYSIDGDVTGHHGGIENSDIWIVKLDNAGIIQWQKSLGGSGNELGLSVQQTLDSGYIIVGTSLSNDGDVSGHHGSLDTSDYWVVKLDTVGAIQWQKSIGGSSHDHSTFIRQTTDAGYIISGLSNSINGDASGNHGSSDYWIVKLDSTGAIDWQKQLGGTKPDNSMSVQQTTDGGYLAIGYSFSNDGDVSGHHGSTSTMDYWIVKLSVSGAIQWEKSFGGSDNDMAQTIWQTADGGYVVGGWTFSNDGDVTLNHGGWDSWLIKLGNSGSIQWQRTYGGSTDDQMYSIQQTLDGGYITANNSWSNDGDVSGNHGYSDYWIIKLSPLVGFSEIVNGDLKNISPNPFTTHITIHSTATTITLFSPTGQQILHQTTTSAETILNTESLAVGLYFFRVEDEEGVRNYKVVKQ
jgi:hypothetical protein